MQSYLKLFDALCDWRGATQTYSQLFSQNLLERFCKFQLKGF